uniref:Putative dna transposase thap9 n=1 Tax=Lutzomyia longipalpis TaxID=7200 RepID=A0A1B0CBA5_LUTLO
MPAMRCIVEGCENTLRYCPPGVTFHRFPQDIKLARKWKILVNLGTQYVTKESDRVCSQHFSEEDFEYRRFRDKFKKYLRTKSVPQPQFDVDEYTLQLLEQDEPYSYMEQAYVTEPMPEPPLAVTHEQSDEESNGMSSMMYDNSNAHYSNHNVYAAGSSSYSVGNNTHKRPMLAFPVQETKKMRYPAGGSVVAETTTTSNIECDIELEKVKIESLSELLSELKEKNYIGEEVAEMIKDTIGPNEDLFDEMIKETDFKAMPLTFQPVMKDFALTLDFLAPRAYRYIYNEYKSFLPHPNTFAVWYKCTDADPGFTQESLDTLTELVKSEREQGRSVICQLAFDEKDIFPQVQKIGEKCFGYCTVTTVDKPSNDVATQVLLFMLIDINGAWKVPIGYFPVKHMNSEMKQNLIEKAILNAEATGAKVLGITFNGVNTNFSAMKLLGASFAMDDPVFSVRIEGESHEKTYFVYPDPLDMIKRVRDTFMFEKQFLDGDGNIVDYTYVGELLNLYEKGSTQTDLKPIHAYFQRKKLNLNLVVQLLNKSVADALDHCRTNYSALNVSQFGGCEATSKFIRMMSNVFEVLKSHQQANAEKSSILIGNLRRIKQFCENAQKYLFDLCLLSNVQTTSEGDEIRYTFSEKESVISSSKKAGFLGLLICLDNLPKIFESAQSDLRALGLKTYFLNQDSIEQFYYSIKTNLCDNTNPSILQFRDAYKKLITHAQMIRDNTGSRIAGTESVKILNVNPERCLQVINNTSKVNIFESVRNCFKDEGEFEEVVNGNFRTNDEVLKEMDFVDVSTKLTEVEAFPSETESQKSIIMYTTGFIVKTILTKAHCTDCTAIIVDDGDESNSAYFDRYGFEKYPSKFVIDICELMEEIFQGEVGYLGINFILQNRHENEMISQVTKHFDFESDHFVLNKAHKYSMIELVSGLFLKCRIYHELNKVTEKDEMKNVYRILVHFENL